MAMLGFSGGSGSNSGHISSNTRSDLISQGFTSVRDRKESSKMSNDPSQQHSRMDPRVSLHTTSPSGAPTTEQRLQHQRSERIVGFAHHDQPHFPSASDKAKVSTPLSKQYDFASPKPNIYAGQTVEKRPDAAFDLSTLSHSTSTRMPRSLSAVNEGRNHGGDVPKDLRSGSQEESKEYSSSLLSMSNLPAHTEHRSSVLSREEIERTVFNLREYVLRTGDLQAHLEIAIKEKAQSDCERAHLQEKFTLKLSMAEQKVHDLDTELAAVRSLHDDLQKSHREATAKEDQASRRVAALEMQSSKLQKDVERSEAIQIEIRKGADDRIGDLKAQIQACECQIDAMREAESKLVKQNSELQSKYEREREELAICVKEKERYAKSLQDAESVRATLEEEMRGLREENGRLLNNVKEAESKLKELLKDKCGLQETLKAHSDEIESLKSEIDSLSAQIKSETSLTRQKVEELRACSKALNEVRMELEEQKEDKERLRQQLESETDDNARLRSISITKAKEMGEKEMELRLAKRSNAEAQRELAQLKDEMKCRTDQHQAQMDDLLKQLKEKRVQLERFEQLSHTASAEPDYFSTQDVRRTSAMSNVDGVEKSAVKRAPTRARGGKGKRKNDIPSIDSDEDSSHPSKRTCSNTAGEALKPVETTAIDHHADETTLSPPRGGAGVVKSLRRTTRGKSPSASTGKRGEEVPSKALDDDNDEIQGSDDEVCAL